MNDVINSKSGSLNISTYNAIQNIKYTLSTADKSVVEYFGKADFLHDKIDPTLCKNMQSAFKNYKQALEKEKTKVEKCKATLHVDLTRKTITKRKAKEIEEKAAKKARLGHISSVCQRKKKTVT
jgi:hypothetical protein